MSILPGERKISIKLLCSHRRLSTLVEEAGLASGQSRILQKIIQNVHSSRVRNVNVYTGDDA